MPSQPRPVTPERSLAQNASSQVLAQWHTMKNGDLTPADVTVASHTKVWWLCEEGHEWETKVSQRTKPKPTGCPTCYAINRQTGYRAPRPGQSLAENASFDLLSQWHPDKNGHLTPSDVTAKSGQKAWWLCPEGHTFEALISNRSNGSGCPMCSGNNVFPGINDLATTHPELAAQWHPAKNERTVNSVAADSSGKAWWQCDLGHEWEALIGSRTRAKTKCPYCSGRLAISGETDLATTHPQIAQEWHPSRNEHVKVDNVTERNVTPAWWLCKDGHNWQATVRERTKDNRSCSICSGRIVELGFNDLMTTHPEVASEWHPTKNAPYTPYALTAKSDQRIWWQCTEGHEWEARPWDRTRGDQRNTACPYCGGKQVIIGINDLMTLRPLLAQEWSPGQPKTPSEVSVGSGYQALWNCALGHTYRASVYNRVQGSQCHYCSGRLALHGYNDLETLHPLLMDEWDFEKNTAVLPSEVRPGSEQKAWWKCQNGHSWDAMIRSRVKGSGCPGCSPIGSSQGEEQIADWLISLGIQIQRRDRSLVSPYEIDILIPDHKFAIEFNGVYWHSEAVGKTRSYHQAKLQSVQATGTTLFQVWEDNWKNQPEIVKRMILHRLGLSQEPVVFARKTEIKTVSTKEAHAFLEMNHIQGKANGGLYLGLVSKVDQSLVALMVLKLMPGGVVYLERYATACRVPGGFTRLLKNAVRILAPSKVITFADQSISDGNLYEQNGFIVDGYIPPDYTYLVRQERVHKFNYRIKRFREDPSLLFEENLTESQLAKLNKLHRIWDSGKIRYVLAV